MFDIFPELHNSSEIIFLSPSKKAIRRFPTCDPAPKPLRSTFWAQKILDDRIRVYVAEIADLSLRVVPSLMERLNTDGKNSARSTTRETSALLLVPSFEIRRRLFQKQGYQTSKVAERTHHTKVNGICSFGIKPGRTAVSNALEAPSYPDLLAPVMQKIPLQT